MNQEISFCTTSDGVQLAYSTMGDGPTIVRTGNWLTHLDFELKSPVWRHVILGLAHRHRLVRYDSRGVGLSQRGVEEVSFQRWVEDIETVVDAVPLQRFILLGISQGVSTAIGYAVRHPERVSHLILYGGYARGLLHREDPVKAQERLALSRALVREGWGTDSSHAYRMFFTSQFIPGATAEQQRAGEPAHRAFLDAVSSFLGETPIKGPLPGTASRGERIDSFMKGVEQSWIIKVFIILAAITGVFLFGVEMWRMMQH